MHVSRRILVACLLLLAAWSSGVLVGCSADETGGPGSSPDERSGGGSTSPTFDVAGLGPSGPRLQFSIRDENGNSLAGRLTLVPLGIDGLPAAQRAPLFPQTQVAPGELAVRRNVVYSRHGVGAITVPPGRYSVWASKGMEWSADEAKVDLSPGEVARFDAILRHEVDTTGWIGADLQLHTVTYSGHGDANLDERILSVVGEGLEFVVASDHDHLTSYGEAIAALELEQDLAWAIGDEVTTSEIGHFNLFPLTAGEPTPDPSERDPRLLFELLHEAPSPTGNRPLLQLNHPRAGHSDYFGEDRLDPVTGESSWARYSGDFDLVEVLNGNVARGYFDLDLFGPHTDTFGLHWALGDWFHLLNRGIRRAATGSSDSHHVENILAGYPRNFIASSTDDPAALQLGEIVDALRGGRSFTTTGPFVDLEVNGVALGGLASALDRKARVDIGVQAASWVDCDRVRIVVNGDVARVLELPDTRQPVRMSGVTELDLSQDSWICLLVEGDDSLAPIVHDGNRPVWPLAVTNPVWVDVDGDGAFTPPSERMAERVESSDFTAETLGRLESTADCSHLMLEAAGAKHPRAKALLTAGLEEPRRELRLAACRAAERLGDPALMPLLESSLRSTLESERDDPWLAVCQMRALHRLGGRPLVAPFEAFLERFGTPVVHKYADALFELTPDRDVSEWMILGPFPCDRPRCVTQVEYGPETDGDARTAWTTDDGRELSWRRADVNEEGFLDLAADPGPGDDGPELYFARAWLHSETSREVLFAVDFADRIRMICNDTVVLDDTRVERTRRFAHVWRMPLRAGWNRLLVKLERDVGNFGLRLLLLEDGITVSAER